MAPRAWAALRPPIRSCDNCGVAGRVLGEPHSPPSHISKIVLSIVKKGPPEKARTGHSGRGGSPIHISKTVPPTVHSGPPLWTPYIWTSHRKVRNSVRLGPPEEARTTCKGHGARAHRPPSHISNTVLASVHIGPPKFCNSFLQGPIFHPGWASLDPDGEAGFGA